MARCGRARAIGGAIVNDDDFKILKSLFAQGGQAQFKVVFAIPGGNGDGNGAMSSRCSTSSCTFAMSAYPSSPGIPISLMSTSGTDSRVLVDDAVAEDRQQYLANHGRVIHQQYIYLFA